MSKKTSGILAFICLFLAVGMLTAFCFLTACNRSKLDMEDGVVYVTDLEVNYTSETDSPKGDIDDDSLQDEVIGTTEVYYMVMDFTMQMSEDSEGKESLTVSFTIDDDTSISCTIADANTGTYSENTYDGVTTLSATFSLPEKANQKKTARVVISLDPTGTSGSTDISYSFSCDTKSVNLESQSDYVVAIRNKTIEIATASLEYSLNSGGTSYSITGSGNRACNVLYIPETYNNIPVTTISANAFEGVSSLKKLYVPDSITYIASDAFKDCTSLTTATLGSALPYISADLFYGCTSLTSVTISSNITSVGASAFYNCTSLTDLTLPSSVTAIGASAFYGCSSLTSINLGSSITAINESTFYGCSSLTEITIPESVKTIGKKAFYGCSAVTTINYNAKTVTDLTEEYVAFCGVGADGDGIALTIGANVTKIPAYLFYASSSSYVPLITSVTFADGSVCASIGESAFKYSAKLTSLTLPESVTAIGDEAFSSCTSLVNLTLGSGLETIGEKAFYGCSAITSLAIPESVTSIGDGAFYNLTALKSLAYNAESVADFESDTTVFYNAGRGGDGITLTIGANVTKVPAYMFYISASSLYIPKIASVTFANNGACTSIGDYAFYYSNSITSLTLPNNLSTIGAYAFCNCSGVTSLTIPEGVTEIGAYAFYNLSALTDLTYNAKSAGDLTSTDKVFYNAGQSGDGITLTIGAAVTKIPAYLFYFTDSSSTSHLPKIISAGFEDGSACTSIGAYAFYGNAYITELALPDNLSAIGDYAFYNCSGVTSLTVPEGVTEIGTYAFYNLSALTTLDYNAKALADFTADDKVFYNAGQSGSGITLTIGAAVTKIPAYLFYFTDSSSTSHLPKIASVTFADGNECTSIGDYAFYGSKYFSTLTIPRTVSAIGDYAFYGCSLISLLIIPSGMRDLGDYAFAECSALSLVNFADGIQTIGEYAFYNDSLLTRIVLPDSLVSIGDYAFNGCSAVAKLTFGTGLKTIGDYAFYGCTKLTDLTLPAAVTSVGDYAFYGCTAITEISGADSLSTIGEYAFYGCTSLQSLYVPKTVTKIGDNAFGGCTSITAVYIDDFAAWCKITFTAASANPVTLTENVYFYNGTSEEYEVLTDVVIPDGVTAVGDYAFYSYDKLTSVTFNDSLTSIGDYAFYGCTKIQSVTIPDKTATIGEYAFYGCSAVTEVYFGSGLTTIGDYAFYNCSLIESLSIPAKTTAVGGYAFYGCSALTAVSFGSGLKTIGEYAFYNCSAIETLTVPDSATAIGDYAFYGCSAITEVNLGTGLKTVGTAAFSGCTSIAKTNITNLVSWCNIDFASETGNPMYYASNLYLNGEVISGDVVLSGSVTAIPYGTFKNSAITSIVVPDSVTYIGGSAFSGCASLTSMTLPFVGESAKTSSDTYQYPFGYIFGTTSYTGGTSTSQTYRGSSVSSTTTTTYYIPTTLTSVTITGGNILYGAFYNCTNLTNITLGNVTSIGDYAFRGCSSLATLNGETAGEFIIPDSVTSIGLGAFGGCSLITNMTLPFVGGSAKTSSDTYQYPFGYIFGTSSYTGGTGTSQTYHGSSASSTTSTTYYIPTTLTSVTITGGNILYGAFYNCTKLTEINLPEGVTAIGASAFYGCTSITEINIPEAVTSIGTYAYYNCTAVTAINYNAKAVADLSSKNYIFYNAGKSSADITVTIGAKVTNIPAYLFNPRSSTAYAPKITSVVFAEKGVCESIGSYAFAYCSSLTSITVPDTVTSIGLAAFAVCSGLTSITLPFVGDSAKTSSDTYQYSLGYVFGTTSYTGGTATSQKYYGSSASSTTTTTYYIPTTLTSVTITGGNILYGAFYNCTKLTEINLPEGVTAIGENAFYGCTALTEFTVPDSVTSIGLGAFGGCTALTSMTLPFVGDSVKTSEDTYQYPLGYIFGTASYTGGTATTQRYYGSDLTSSDYTIYYIPTTLKSVTVTGDTILYGAFYGCSNLTEIIFTENLTTINGHAFNSCKGLTSIVIPDSVTSIGNYAFSYCTGVTSLTIGSGLKTLGEGAFYNCTALTAINYNATAANDLSASNYVFADGGQSGDGITLTIGANVTKIPASLFNSYSTNTVAPKIISVVFAEDCVCASIGERAFYYCTSLTQITLADSVTSVGNLAFMGCSSLASVVMGEGLSKIGTQAFFLCTSLTEVTISAGVTEIGMYAFMSCDALESVTFADTTGWYLAWSSGGEEVKDVVVTDAAKNATNIVNQYSEYYWIKTEE